MFLFNLDLNIKEDNHFLKDYLHESYFKYKIIELEITGEAFLYKMIRKLVGAMVCVAKNRLCLKTLEKMMTCPPDYYDINIEILKPEGLILKKVLYDENDLDYTDNDYENYLNQKNIILTLK